MESFSTKRTIELHDKVLCYSKKSSASLSAFQVNSRRNCPVCILPKKKTGQTVKNANACNTVQSSTLIIALLESCKYNTLRKPSKMSHAISNNVYIAQNKKSPNSFVEEKLGIERDETVMDDGLEEMIMNPGIGLLALLYSVVEIHYDKLCKEGI